MARLIRPIKQLSPHLLPQKLRHTPSSLPALLLLPSISTLSSPPQRRLNPRKPRPPSPDALSPTVSVEEDGGFETSKSRNHRKRDSRRAVRWGMELATFSNDQIKRILRAVSLSEDVYDALMLAKRLGPDVREGKRRQFNFIGKLLREVEPDMMDTLIHATKHGDNSTLQALLISVKDNTVGDVGDSNDDTETEPEDEVEGSEEEYMIMASRWFDGLISRNVEVMNEVYSLQSVDFDRQELRKLVRRVELVHQQKKDTTPEKQKEIDAAVATAEKSLNRFLRSLAKQMQTEQTNFHKYSYLI